MSLTLRATIFYVFLALFGGNRLSYILFRFNGVYLFEPFLLLLIFLYVYFFPVAASSFRSLVLSRVSCLLIGIVSFVFFWTLLVNPDALFANVFKEYRCYLYMIFSFISVVSISKTYPEAVFPAIFAFSLSNIFFAELSVLAFPDVEVLAMVGGLRKLLPSESILLLQVCFVRRGLLPLYVVPPVIAILFFFQGLYRTQLIVAVACVLYPLFFSDILAQIRFLYVSLRSRIKSLLGLSFLFSLCLIGSTYTYRYLVFLFEDNSNPLVSRFVVGSLERLFSYDSGMLSVSLDGDVDQSRSLYPFLDDIHCLILPNGFGVHAPGARSFGESCFSSYVRFSDDSMYLYLPHAFGIVFLFIIFLLALRYVIKLFSFKDLRPLYMLLVLMLMGVGSADLFVVSAVSVSSGVYLASIFVPDLTPSRIQ